MTENDKEKGTQGTATRRMRVVGLGIVWWCMRLARFWRRRMGLMGSRKLKIEN